MNNTNLVNRASKSFVKSCPERQREPQGSRGNSSHTKPPQTVENSVKMESWRLETKEHRPLTSSQRSEPAHSSTKGDARCRSDPQRDTSLHARPDLKIFKSVIGEYLFSMNQRNKKTNKANDDYKESKTNLQVKPPQRETTAFEARNSNGGTLDASGTSKLQTEQSQAVAVEPHLNWRNRNQFRSIESHRANGEELNRKENDNNSRFECREINSEDGDNSPNHYASEKLPVYEHSHESEDSWENGMNSTPDERKTNHTARLEVYEKSFESSHEQTDFYPDYQPCEERNWREPQTVIWNCHYWSPESTVREQIQENEECGINFDQSQSDSEWQQNTMYFHKTHMIGRSSGNKETVRNDDFGNRNLQDSRNHYKDRRVSSNHRPPRRRDRESRSNEQFEITLLDENSSDSFENVERIDHIKNKSNGHSPSSQSKINSNDIIFLDKNKRKAVIEERKIPVSQNSEVSKGFDSFEAPPEVLAEYQDFNKVRFNINCDKITEKHGDLFAMSKTWSLAHCVAEDMNMNSGIAIAFRRVIGHIGELLNQRQKTGGLAILKVKSAFVYYLVTKKLSRGKPTYLTLLSSLLKLRDHVIQNDIEKLAMPRMGCGLDKLEWSVVKPMIGYVFANVDIEITVCRYFDENAAKLHTCPRIEISQPVHTVKEGAIIVFFTSELGDMPDDAKTLLAKFDYRSDTSTSDRILGNVKRFDVLNKYYIIYGCVCKKRTSDPIDYVALESCISIINESNRKDLSEHIAFQAVREKDDCANEKILNILRNTMDCVTVTISRP